MPNDIRRFPDSGSPSPFDYRPQSICRPVAAPLCGLPARRPHNVARPAARRSMAGRARNKGASQTNISQFRPGGGEVHKGHGAFSIPFCARLGAVRCSSALQPGAHLPATHNGRAGDAAGDAAGDSGPATPQPPRSPTWRMVGYSTRRVFCDMHNNASRSFVLARRMPGPKADGEGGARLPGGV